MGLLDFHQSQEALSVLEWILRAIIAFVFLVVVAKVLGQRTISKLRLLDFVIALVIGNIIAHPLSDQHTGMKGSMITTSVLVVLYCAGIALNLKWPWFRRLVSHPPITIIENGKIMYDGLIKAKISLDDVLEEMREKKIVDFQKVALAVWEADGRISFFLDPQYEPLTPAALGVKTEPFDLPRVIIKEGTINHEELQQTGKNVQWVVSELENSYHAEVKDVLLTTLDKQDNLRVFFYKNEKT
ncbi:DUF421 domain-containing protein [Bacillus sp. B-jedd]|uniref:DUF421 domain-containing protein n=1 Tax=Bacillus sp. B-jedd TaxID=1476857 RepID=UPI000515612E|nr:DUF421 domain-containing protein [Bacillus sp. B-jedd]CEG28912.1 hypothetical protein BN1002_03837 [Bacillus sp. B-jedd]